MRSPTSSSSDLLGFFFGVWISDTFKGDVHLVRIVVTGDVLTAEINIQLFKLFALLKLLLSQILDSLLEGIKRITQVK